MDNCDNKLKCILECNNNDERIQLFHNSIRKTPIRKVLTLVDKAYDNKDYYLITVFIATFSQFPIFKYLFCLDVYFNNNHIYIDIKNILTKLNTVELESEININKEKSNNNTFKLNKDWIELYKYILSKDMCKGIFKEYDFSEKR